MRDFFINAFEKLVAVIVVLMCLGVVVGAAAVSFGGGMGPGGGQGGILQGLLVLVAGAIYVVFLGGAMYLGLGIYQNTKRSADLLERIAAKQG